MVARRARDAEDGMYRVIYADPAWRFDDALPGDTRGAEKQYEVLTIEQLKRLPLPPLQPDGLLFMWRVSALQEEACQVARAWGTSIKSEIVWNKLTRKGKDHFGMGRYVRMSHETCLLAAWGRPKVKVRNIRSRFCTEGEAFLDEVAPLLDLSFDAVVREHSRKPDEMYEIIEALSDGPYCELFARQQRPGWDAIGNEVTGDQKLHRRVAREIRRVM